MCVCVCVCACVRVCVGEWVRGGSKQILRRKEVNIFQNGWLPLPP